MSILIVAFSHLQCNLKIAAVQEDFYMPNASAVAQVLLLAKMNLVIIPIKDYF